MDTIETTTGAAPTLRERIKQVRATSQARALGSRTVDEASDYTLERFVDDVDALLSEHAAALRASQEGEREPCAKCEWHRRFMLTLSAAISAGRNPMDAAQRLYDACMELPGVEPHPDFTPAPPSQDRTAHYTPEFLVQALTGAALDALPAASPHASGDTPGESNALAGGSDVPR